MNARLHVTELVLDHAKRGLNLGAHLSLGVLDLALGFGQHAALTQLFLNAAAGCEPPDHLPTCMFRFFPIRRSWS